MYKLLIITTFFVFFKQNYFATSNFEKIARKSINDSTYLVIGLEETDQSAVNSVRLQIETLSNCKILAYSNKLNVFILKFNNTNDLNDSNLFNLVQEAVTSYKLYTKLGTLKNILVNIPKAEMTDEIKFLISN